MPSFDEGRLKDPQGRPFAKFKAFVREAERRGVLSVHSSGSVKEVVLPDEDPREVSQFSPEPEVTEDEEHEPSASSEPVTFSAKDWAVFEESLKQIGDAALFIQIYDSLRGLRNKEIIDLSNSDIKLLIKEAINEGLLKRITRGPHAYYELDSSRPFRPSDE
jgi:hypothetical protein